MNNTKKGVRIECECENPSHFVSLEKWDDVDFGYMFMAVYEADRRTDIYTRIKNAIWYIFKAHDLNFAQIVFDKNKAEEIRDYLNSALPTKE